MCRLPANHNKSKGLPQFVIEKHGIDEYKALLKYLKVAHLGKAKRTGIEEEHFEWETLLHDVFSEVKEDNARRETLREANAAHEKRLVRAVKRIGTESMAMSEMQGTSKNRMRMIVLSISLTVILRLLERPLQNVLDSEMSTSRNLQLLTRRGLIQMNKRLKWMRHVWIWRKKE